MRDFADQVSSGNPLGPLYADSAAYMIVANLLRLAGEIVPPKSQTRPLDDQTLKDVIASMEDRLGEQVPIAELARLADMDVYRFSRAFRAATGESPHQHLLQRRIERARDLMRTTPDTLAAIALDCGFSSQSHMTSAFTKATGTPPGQWRRAQRD